MNHEVRTWRDLHNVLSTLSEEQLDSDLAVELGLSEEVFSSSNDGVRFQVSRNHDVLDDNHPVIVVQS